MNMVSWTYIWSQILTVIEYGLLGASYFGKKRLIIVILDILSTTAGMSAYLLLGADAGIAMSVVIILANFYFLYDEKKQGKNHALQVRDYVALVVIMLAIAVLAVVTYDGPLSLLSVIATALYEISIWQNSTKVYKFLGIPVALCWILYNVFVRSIFGVICETVMFVASIVGYVREVRAGKRKTKKRTKR